MKNGYEKTGLALQLRESFFGFSSEKAMSTTKLITIMGVLAALCIVVERTIYIPVGDTSRYSFTFVAVALSSIVLGGLKGAVVAGVADVIGSLIVYGNANPLITACVCITAINYGLFLYNKRSIPRIVLAVIVDQVICSLLLKTAALSVWYYGGMNAYPVVFMTRLVQVGVMIPLQIVVLIILEKYLFGIVKKLVKDFVE